MAPADTTSFEATRSVLRHGGAPPAARAMADEFDAFVARVRAGVEARLEAWLDERVADARRRGDDVGAIADAVRVLARRGGKRMRAVLLSAAYDACGGDGGDGAVVLAGVALELLQAYLLVHDDWMDGDSVRRGGPSVPAVMVLRFGQGARADAMSVLAGDLACAWAQRALLEVPRPPADVIAAARELARVQEEVTQGQMLDVGGGARDAHDVEAMHALKTASYSVHAPVVMGARLAGATERQVQELAAFARPLGVAFQLRDDVLGVFGEVGTMGKPAGTDLRAGKRTAVVIEAMRDAQAAAALARVQGRAGAGDDDVRAAVAAIDACGARARVEGRIRALVGESRAALERAPLSPCGRAFLSRAIDALTDRRA